MTLVPIAVAGSSFAPGQHDDRVSFYKVIVDERFQASLAYGRDLERAPALQNAVMDAYSFDNHALLRLHETLKDKVDPNGIISAGRYGIWPKHLRGTKA